jgi:NADPH:quinone reductase
LALALNKRDDAGLSKHLFGLGSLSSSIQTKISEGYMAKAIVLREHGSVDKLCLDAINLSSPAAGELRIRQTAIGVNFHDIYVRTGLYKTLSLPGIPGIEAVGVIEGLGKGVTVFHEGDRVGYVTSSYGAYATHRNLRADMAIRIPDSMDDQLAATLLLKGLTVEMLINRVYQLEPGHVVLVHAAAGGVGRLLVQWAKARGAIVYGTAGTSEKMRIAQDAGCDAIIPYRQTDFAEEVLRLTDGRGVDVVYDSVGHDTFNGSLRCLAKFGRLVNFGQSSGSIPAFEISRLASGSFSLVRPIVFHYLDVVGQREKMARNFFDAFEKGAISANVGTIYPLSEVGSAHLALEARSNKAPFILVP